MIYCFKRSNASPRTRDASSDFFNTSVSRDSIRSILRRTSLFNFSINAIIIRLVTFAYKVSESKNQRITIFIFLFVFLSRGRLMSDPTFLADGSGIAPHIPLAKVRKVGLGGETAHVGYFLQRVVCRPQ